MHQNIEACNLHLNENGIVPIYFLAQTLEINTFKACIRRATFKGLVSTVEKRSFQNKLITK